MSNCKQINSSTKLKSKKASSLNRSIKKSQEILKKNWIIQDQKSIYEISKNDKNSFNF